MHEIPEQGAWLKVPLGKLDTERMVPLDEETITLIDRIVAQRSPGRPIPHPRTHRPTEFLLTRHGQRISTQHPQETLRQVTRENNLPHTTPHQLRLALLTGDWKQTPTIKARLVGGSCVRAQAQGPCAHANICEHCPSFRTDAGFLPVLAAQCLDAEALAADAQARGWITEADRHHQLIARLDAHIQATPRHRLKHRPNPTSRSISRITLRQQRLRTRHPHDQT